MLFYHAGTHGLDDGSNEVLFKHGLRSRLLAYGAIPDQHQQFWLDDAPDNAQVFIDSGAFSAHTQGKPVSLTKYCEFLTKYPNVSEYAALDVIGDPMLSRCNTEEMEVRGLKPIPTFHRGSSWQELQRIAERYERFALGGVASEGTTRGVLQPWLDGCFYWIKKHWPRRVHGFGIQAQWAIERYPFYSCDSTNVLKCAAFGDIIRFRNGRISIRDWEEDAKKTFDGGIMGGPNGERPYLERQLANLEALNGLRVYVTELWTKRGVTWHDK
jgi:hypothetical protein|tara:strand:- start:43291 stop:44100 length:810 start_codon:yes stop_codon:yes gene_type:complete